MSSVVQQSGRDVDSAQECEPYFRDLVRELSTKLDAPGRYDECILNAEGHPAVQELWRALKRQACSDIEPLKELIVQELQRRRQLG